MKSNLVVLINPSHNDEVDEKIAVSYGAKSRKIKREDPPISIINLGGFIRDHGYEVVIIDTGVEPDYKTRLKDLVKESPLLIGLSVILGKFTKNAISLTKFVRELNDEIPIVWGGKLVPLAGSKILDHIDVDFLISGDGEYPLLNLLECIANNRDYKEIPGLGFKEKDQFFLNPNTTEVTNLDDIYISKDFGWGLLGKHINFRQVPYFINLYTSRGCKFNCTFCYLKDIRKPGGKRFRRRSAENIIKEIDYLHNHYGINVFTFGDDDFLSNVNQILPVFEYFKRNNLYIEHIWTSIYNLKPETIELLTGICQTVCYSIETSSRRLQKILRKVIPIERVIEVNQRLRKAGINTVHNFLFGIPTETIEETKANIDLMKKLKEINPHVRANTYILSPIPETPLFEYVEELEHIKINWDLQDIAEFHFRYMGKALSKFRPYHSLDDNLFFETVSELTNEFFTELNNAPKDEQLKRIASDERLSYTFGDVQSIPKPKERERKYILDLVLNAMDAGKELPKIRPF